MKNTLTFFLLFSSFWLAAQPVAVDDAAETIQGAYYTKLSLGVMNNDVVPSGETIRIHSIVQPASGSAVFTHDTIRYSSVTFCGFFGADSLQYRVCLESDSTIISNLATVRINILPDSLHPVTHPDYGEADLGLWKSFDVLANDVSLNGEPIRLNSFTTDNLLVEVKLNNADPNHLKLDVKPLHPDTMIKIAYFASVSPLIFYRVTDTLYVDVKKGHAVERMNINNISTYINADALMFGSKYVSGAFVSEPCYEVPEESGKGTIFAASPWIGGKDSDGAIHLAAERYAQAGFDFWPGPVSDTGAYKLQPDSTTRKVYFVTKNDIHTHLRNYGTASYTPVWPIANWPGNGDTTLGQAWQLAPFIDQNQNGVYEPLLGDFPKVRGDASAFYILNDQRNQHTEIPGLPLGAEFHCMVYAFDQPDDSLLNNTLFVHYDIYNRSENQYDSTWFGFWTDLDLGFATDDYVGCDVTNSFYYAYNGDTIDGTGQHYAYGSYPPIQSVAFLGGAKMDADEADNPKFDVAGNLLCGDGINGTGFGDGVTDNERLGMTRSFFNRTYNISYTMTPNDWYNVLQGKFYFGETLLFGGNGHPSTGGVGPAAKYIFPGDSDPMNWGTWCLPPNGGYNQNGKYWTEAGEGNQPGDRQLLGSTGPFTFKPGDCQQIDLALVTTWNTANPDPLASLGKMQQYVATLRTCFEADSVPGGGTFSGHDVGITKPQQKPTMNLVVYPNPAGDYIIVSGIQGQGKADYQISDITGKILVTGTSTSQQFKIDTSNLNAGLYILTLTTQQSRGYCKFIKD